MKKIKFDNIRMVLFSPGIVIINKLEVAHNINKVLSSLFDGDPVIVPLSEDAPSELPRIQLNSEDGIYSLSIAKNRIDFVFRNKNHQEKIFLPFEELFEKFITVSEFFKKSIHTQFTRVGVVAHWFIELEKVSSGKYLLLNYIREDAPITEDPYQLELHYLARDSVCNFEVNKWIRIKTSEKASESNLISFLVDINTIAEKIYEFDENSLRDFLKESRRIFDSILKKHFRKMEE